MKYDNGQLQRSLAAEYALGTLAGRARRRFERLVQRDAAWLAELRYWESRLAQLALRLKPVAPPDAVWQALQQQIRAEAAARVVPIRRPEGPLPPMPKHAANDRQPKSPPPWRILAGLATAAGIVVAVVIGQRVPLPARQPGVPAVGVAQAPAVPTPAPVAAPDPTYVALLKLPESNMQWTLSLAPGRSRITVAASGEYAKLGQHSLELWAITPAGPVSLGLLPVSGRGEMKMPDGLALDGAPTLAVSLEPVGGSPTGKPTGPVLTSGDSVPTA